ncbi:nuclear transport factor 2 family protein [Natrialba sp. PRR66]|uniref:nuclear transport factor 2 family protein n=1 Tax=Natrialba sp. PRR66 TaxID=3098146 RepID=UPI002B1E49AF|nr:nuclear transport factor 2 family protein [Natrialba sp. PRR66]
MDATGLVRRYYDALDAHDYDELEAVLAPEFTQRRPDRRFESRAAFIAFMREERPNPDTTHELELVFAGQKARDGEPNTGDDSVAVAVRGRVCDESGELFEFADFFTVDREAERLVRLETYSR